MKTKASTKALALLLALPAVMLGTALGADPIKIAEEDLKKAGSWDDKSDQTVVLENVKFEILNTPNLELAKTRGKLILDDTRNPERTSLINQLVAFKDAKGVALAQVRKDKRYSNVRIVGIARNDASGRIVEVTDVQKMDDDVPAYQKRVDALAATDAPGREAFAADALKRANEYSEDDLRDWARKTYEAAFDLNRDKAKASPDTAVELAKKYRDLAQANQKAIDLLGPIAVDPSVPDKKREELRALLDTDYSAILHRGKWMSKDDFHASLGYLARKDSKGATIWVRRERAEFLEEVEKRRNDYVKDQQIRHLMDSQYQAEASKGNLVEGMYKQEVVRVKKLPGDSYYGFPESVDRFTETIPRFRPVTWDQWVMPDGGRIYFVDGMFFLEKKKTDPLPSK